MSAAVAGNAASPTAVVLAHGAGQGMDSGFMEVFHAGLAERGCLAVRFNFPYKEQGRKLVARFKSVMQQKGAIGYTVAAIIADKTPAPPSAGASA